MNIEKILSDVVSMYSRIPDVYHISFVPRTDALVFIIYYNSDHYDPDKFGILVDQEVLLIDKYPEIIFDMSYIPSDGRDVIERDGSIEIYPKDGIGDGYCPTCGSCGIDDCCSAIRCLKKHIKTSGACFNGNEYVKDIEFYYCLGKTLYNKIVEHNDASLLAIADCEYDELYRAIYLTNE